MGLSPWRVERRTKDILYPQVSAHKYLRANLVSLKLAVPLQQALPTRSCSPGAIAWPLSHHTCISMKLGDWIKGVPERHRAIPRPLQELHVDNHVVQKGLLGLEQEISSVNGARTRAKELRCEEAAQALLEQQTGTTCMEMVIVTALDHDRQD